MMHAPIVIIRNPGQNPADILWPALKIGHNSIIGELAGGVLAWTADGKDLATTRLVGPSDVDAAVVDVRQEHEYASGHLPGAQLIELGSLADQVSGIPAGPVMVMCSHGERATSGASLLERAGRRDLSILDGDAQDWAKAARRSLDTGR